MSTVPLWLPEGPAPPLVRVETRPDLVEVQVQRTGRIHLAPAALLGALATFAVALSVVYAIGLPEPVRSLAFGLLLVFQLLVCFTPLAYAGVLFRVAASYPRVLQFGAHHLVWRDSSGVERGRVRVHELDETTCGGDALGPLVFLRHGEGQVAMRWEDEAQAVWMVELLKTWRTRQQRNHDAVSASEAARLGVLRVQ